ncbi:MAG: DNA polymerase III subunit gamma/tau [Acidobacteria bacterium]|nr:DNA polymerase III subunit gamma/tau [Acidobacteriota bacterium]
MYQVIARKYRPRSFAELIGQEHVRTTLENALAQGRIAHGYIFSGQRGTGKTTVARIVARCLNCQQGPTVSPCGECANCLEIAGGGSIDVIEIDAASNRGINEMRELRENVRFRPARDRYKIFIIDEAHQITSEAFNALLKTLEEPPEWVVFVLCTTESHKIPNTIASRCQQFSFRSVDFDLVLERLESICRQEGIEADQETLGVLALAGEGSVRDSLSALDQAIACCGQKLEVAEVRQLLGRFSLQTLEQVAAALLAQDARRMLDLVQELERNGHNLQHFCRELCRFFRNLLVAKIAGAHTRLVAASGGERERLAALAESFSEEDLTRYLHLSLEQFRDLQFSLLPRLHLELGLVRMVHAGRLSSIEEVLSGLGEQRSAGVSPRPQTAKRSAPPPSPPRQAAGASLWSQRLLAALNEQSMTFIADAVEHAEIHERPGELEFVAAREFAMALRSGDLQKAVEALAGKPLKITVRVAESAATAAAVKAPEDETTHRALDNPEVRRYRELFPGSEVRTVRNLKEQG